MFTLIIDTLVFLSFCLHSRANFDIGLGISPMFYCFNHRMQLKHTIDLRQLLHRDQWLDYRVYKCPLARKYNLKKL